jgi:PKD repeat protein
VMTDTIRVPGGDSWFNTNNSPSTFILARGGAGGETVMLQTPVTRNGAGGVGTTNGSIGDILYAGGSGGTPTGSAVGGSGGGSAGTSSDGNPGSATSGLGATAVPGGGPGGDSNPSGTTASGRTPLLPPGGGGGGARSASSTATGLTGGAGSVGQVILTYAANATVSFTANPTNGVAPLNVTFTDASTGSPTRWAWNFGDAGTSILQNPAHTYTTAGVYTIQLIVSSNSGSSTNTKVAHINVASAQQSWSSCYGVPADSADADGDGLGNTNEFLTGFSPTSATAYAHIIRVESSGSDMNITYLGANGDTTYAGGPSSRTNVLECAVVPAVGSYTNDFVGIKTNWYSAGNGLGTNITVVDEFGATNRPARYYRVRVLAP